MFKSPAGKEKAVLAAVGDSMLEVAHANGIEIEVGFFFFPPLYIGLIP